MALFFTSMPKSGTHLLLPVLEDVLDTTSLLVSKATARSVGIRGGAGQPSLMHGHIRSNDPDVEIDEGIRIVALIRDPRDVVLSMRDYLLVSRKDVHKKVAAQIRDLDDEGQLIAVIDGLQFGDFDVYPADVHCSGFLGWGDRGGAVIRYEDVISSEGPGAIASAIGREDLHDAIEESLAARKFSKTKTFNRGGSRWKSDMSDRVKTHLKRQSSIVEALGYSW